MTFYEDWRHQMEALVGKECPKCRKALPYMVFSRRQGYEAAICPICWDEIGKVAVDSNEERSEEFCMNKSVATFEDAFDLIVSELRELMIRKQRDYGHENITAFGEFGVLVRLNDKVARLRNLLAKGKKPQNESLEDSWRDIANYAIIALMLRRGIFTLPLAENVKCEERQGK